MKNILWVDDEVYALREFYDELKDEGFNIIKATNATHGMKVFLSREYDINLVIIDIMTPSGENFSIIETKGGYVSGLALARHKLTEMFWCQASVIRYL